MKKHSIATIINFCTHESRFLNACIQEASLFSDQVIISVCDHFFDGKSEDSSLLKKIYSAFPKCLFIEYPFIPKKIPKKIFKKIEPAHFWHSLSRLLASQFIKEEIEYVLFLDADEIPDSKRLTKWLDTDAYRAHTALKFANYWYFREERYQAEEWEDSIVFAKRSSLKPQLLLKKEERDAIYDLILGSKERMVVGGDGPMFHHYSWVRSKEEMLKKVCSWGHLQDRDWVALVKNEFTKPFSGKDFVHGYSFKTIEPVFNISPCFYFPVRGKANVQTMDHHMVLSVIKRTKPPFWNLLFSRFL